MYSLVSESGLRTIVARFPAHYDIHIVMACRAIPMIAFPRVRTIYLFIYLFIFIFLCLLTRVYIVYVVKEVASFQGLGQLMGVVRNRTRARALQTSRKKERKMLVVYVETGTNS